jgi:hypothetical protein
MYVYTFYFDITHEVVTIIDLLVQPNYALNGKAMDSIVTINYFIVSCADCS